jgi:hypothetical protein
MKPNFFKQENVRNVNKTGEKCQVCEKGEEINFELFTESEWKLHRACNNKSCDYILDFYE